MAIEGVKNLDVEGLPAFLYIFGISANESKGTQTPTYAKLKEIAGLTKGN